MRKLGHIGVYGPKMRELQRKISFEAFGLTFKHCDVYRYIGSRDNENPDKDDIGTKVFWEVPDRAYHEDIIRIPVGMEPFPEGKVDFSRMGLINPLQDETMFRFHIDDFQPLERKMIIGDVFELPFYSTEEESSFWEVVDVDLKSEKEKYLAIVSAVPLGESRTTREIPVDSGAQDMMDGLMGEMDEEHSEQVPQEGITFDENPAEEDVDYRDDQQGGFLDDPDKEF